MQTKSLREIQQKGERAIRTGDEPILLTTRKGPVGIFVPVTSESVSYMERDLRKMMALQSLRETWHLARETGLDRLSRAEIDREIGFVRKKRAVNSRGKNAKQSHRS